MSVKSPSLTEARAQRAEEIYHQFLRTKREPADKGEVWLSNLIRENTSSARPRLEAILRARQKHPDKVVHAIRTGIRRMGRSGDRSMIRRYVNRDDEAAVEVEIIGSGPIEAVIDSGFLILPQTHTSGLALLLVASEAYDL